MSDGNEICDFVWQHEYRKKWVMYSVEEIGILNKAVAGKQTTVPLPSKNPKKHILLDLEKMIQKNKVSLYEQRVRCLVPNSGIYVWLWKDEHEEWCCYKPYLAFFLEIAYKKQEKTLKFYDNGNYEVNFETLEQINEDTFSTCSVKRESIELSDTAEIKSIIQHNEIIFKAMCSDGAPSAKRIHLDSSSTIGTNSKIDIPSSSFNPMDIDDLTNTEDSPLSSGSSRIVPVDSECPERENFHIYCEGNKTFSATLNQTNLQNNNNKYYIIQLLEHNQRKQFSVWRRWGRVGNKGQRDFSKFGTSLQEARTSFEKKFYDKTRNDWNDMEDFVHVPGKYDLLHMDLNPESEPEVIRPKTDVKSKLAANVQSLLEIICDKTRMEELMKEMSYDSKKTPLGKLTLRQVQEGYTALNKIAEVLSAGRKGSALINACNEFYTKIPHNFGMKTPPIIQTQSDVDEKLQMLEVLSNITVAMGVLNSKSNKAEHPLDRYYHSLNCTLEVMNSSSPEYVELDKCLKGTHGPTHSRYEMEIVDAFKCCKAKEQSSFINAENKLLLWHGSRITNWLGILKQGLRIAPPEAPATGYMFGKGIYFADVSSKSANYCFATKKKNEGVLLLCEVSIGNKFLCTEADGDMPSALPAGYQSVFGKGGISPSDFRTGVLSSEAKAPYGPLNESTLHEGSLQYNEYIVYDIKQVKMQYLLRIKFNFK